MGESKGSGAGKVIRAVMLPGETIRDGMAEWKRLSQEEQDELIAAARAEGLI